jgi:hypothetical protein
MVLVSHIFCKMFVRQLLVTFFAVLGVVAQASDVVVLGVDNFDDIVS